MAEAGSVETWRSECKKVISVLRNITQIHVDIDCSNNKIKEAPDWRLRLRKACCHATMAVKHEIDADGIHAMAVELRAAYEQMDAIWKCLPDEFRVVDDRREWKEIKRMIDEFDHPTPFNLMFPLSRGGFCGANTKETFMQPVLWLGRFTLRYELSIEYLAQEMNAEDGILIRLNEIRAEISSLLSHDLAPLNESR